MKGETARLIADVSHTWQGQVAQTKPKPADASRNDNAA